MDSYLEKSYLDPPKTFSFPFEPYSIQTKFMSNLYSVLENCQLGIFESPTGTGKSLSIICGTLCWLKDHEDRNIRDIKKAIQRLDCEKLNIQEQFKSDWFAIQTKDREFMKLQEELRAQLEIIEKFDKDVTSLKKYTIYNRAKNDNCSDNLLNGSVEKIFDGILNNEFEEDDADELEDPDRTIDANEENNTKRTKIYFCSRTHSQLSQFIVEVKKSPFKNTINLVPLGSRQNYCINPSVRSLSKLSLINEKCLEMNKAKTEEVTAVDDLEEAIKKKKCSSRCPYSKRESIVAFGKELLADVYDVEELVTKGRQMEACPYYTTRLVSHLAQLIVVPYNSLLHKQTREALKINVKNNVVIIDEAHNLLDAISNMYSAEVTGTQLLKCHSLLHDYKQRYKHKFGASNLLNLNQLIYVVGQLISALDEKSTDGSPDVFGINTKCTKIFTIIDFTYQKKIDNFNLYEILSYCSKVKIAHKVQTFSTCRNKHRDKFSGEMSTENSKLVAARAFLQRVIENDAMETNSAYDAGKVTTSAESESESNVDGDAITGFNMFPVLSFIQSLTYDSEDGRIVCNRKTDTDGGSLKFLLLNPAAHFKDIVKDARSVIVAGGTMRPIDEFRTQLFECAGADKSRIVFYSSEHVITSDKVLPIVLTTGPSGKKFDFSYDHRGNLEMINELGVALSNLCNIIPAGIVCFFPSYKYEETVYTHWKNTGMLDRISAKKMIFREPKRSCDVESLLNQYAAAVKNYRVSSKTTSRGALMFSIIGGKLSEGLNFSDDLGRAVIVVGLPYPDNRSPELQEKMSYLDKLMGPGSGRIHYENLCMKAVNQSVGRAIRHKDDYAAIILLDHRYARQNVLESLPSWIKSSIKVSEKFGVSFASINKFFSSKKNDMNKQ